MSTPSLPPRPARSQNPPSASSTNMDAPKIPPRPNRNIERSVSPNRDAFARSPLNDPSFIPGRNRNNLHTHSSLSAPDLVNRPPSVSLPSIGQEGSEYANFNEPQQEEATQTKGIAGDLPLHAPKPSVSASTAKARVAPLTRTDSSTAAAAGIGKAHSEVDDKPTRTSSRSNSSVGGRPLSIHKDDEKEHGIPEIGLQVPMYPDAGDVQMPTPTPSAQGHKPGIGFFNDGSQPSSRHHVRTKSGNFVGPPGSYGLHGHGLISDDPFEKDWYAKHPEALARESQGEYGPAIPESRKEWVLSSEELNKLVHGKKDIGFGTSPNVIGTPDEQVGYMASEEYASRMATPAGHGHGHLPKRRTSSQAHAESPLRKTSFPVGDMDPVVRVKSNRSANDHAIEDDDAHVDTIHVDPPASRHSKIHGGGYDPPVEDLGPNGGNTEERGGWLVEKGYGVPILASDEVAKHPEDANLLPAVDVEQQHRGDTYYAGFDSDAPPMYQSGRRHSSKSSSRPSSIHGGSHGLQRFVSHEDRGDGTGTPLENVREYEPLFPDEDDEKKKPRTAVEKLKRPDLAKHHFPSQDIWEDTPNSLQLQTTVETPQLPEDGEKTADTDVPPSRVFESPEKENARQTTLEPNDRVDYIPEHTKNLAKTHFNRDVLEDMPTRPGLKQRFPSRDIWEDSPDYTQLTTTVASPQIDEISSPVDITSPTDSTTTEKAPDVPPRPLKETQNEQPPSIPPRPQRQQPAGTSPTDRKPPSLPDRPKPQVPPRPAKQDAPVSDGGAPLEKTPSAGSTASDAAKAKPPVPSRPAGGKIAALKAGFMNDLNTRLQLGPQAPKSQEPIRESEVEETPKEPLSDARKGRAKGPARRRPVAEAAGAGATEDAQQGKCEIQTPWSVWSIDDEDGEVAVEGEARREKEKEHPRLPAGSIEGREEEPSEPSTLSKLASSVAAAVGLSSPSPAENSETTKAEPAVAPAPYRPAEEKDDPLDETGAKTETADMATQTGRQDMEIPNGPQGETQKLTAYLGGRAQEEGSVVVDQDGVEQVGNEDATGRVVKTGHGM